MKKKTSFPVKFLEEDTSKKPWVELLDNSEVELMEELLVELLTDSQLEP